MPTASGNYRPLAVIHVKNIRMAGVSKAGKALFICVAVSWLLFGTLGVALFVGWWPSLPRVVPGFGATAQQCEAAFGQPQFQEFAKPQLDPKTLFYSVRGWYFLVGFDEEGHAEKFIVCKANLQILRSAKLSETERKAVLDKFSAGSTWIRSADGVAGPIWDRADGQVIASYINDPHWMVLMNEKAMNRHIERFSGK